MDMDMDMDMGSGYDVSSVQLININGSNDPHYRYKMHPIKTTYIADGGGTTIIDNVAQIAGEIYRDVNDLKGCFAKGAASRVTVKDDKLYISGKYNLVYLQNILTKYIRSSVLCITCGNPETPVWKKKRKCQACGTIM